MSRQTLLDDIRGYFEEVPHARECGIRIDHLSPERVEMALPFRDDWLGDPARGLIHTAVVSMLIDNASGLAALAALPGPGRVATVDLRVDYLGPARRDLELHCEARCIRLARHIVFVQASVWQDQRERPVATSQATFMRSAARRTGMAE